MLAGRTRRQKMKARRRNSADSSGDEDGLPTGRRRRNSFDSAGYDDDNDGSPTQNPYKPVKVSRRDSFASSRSGGVENNASEQAKTAADLANGDKNNNTITKAQVRRSSHLVDVANKEKCLENDEAIKKELNRLEGFDSQWTHPMGFNLLSALRVLNAPADPILNNTGYWIQPEDLDDLCGMFDSYLNVNCLYYSLVGVLAIETSLYLPIPDPSAPTYAQWLITISRFCWAANGVWSMAAVVASFHILWSIYATPTWAKRRFVFDNSRTISVVYALGAPNFAMMLIGTITGVIGGVVNQEGFQKKDWISAAAGLSLGVAVAFTFVLCSGSLISKVVRPWKIADENVRAQKRRWTRRNLGSDGDDFYENYDPNAKEGKKKKKKSEKVDPDGDFKIYDVDDMGFGPMEMPLVAQSLCASGLTLEMLQKVNNEVLLDKLLQGAGVDRAGDRLKVIFFIRDAPLVPTTGTTIEMSSIASGLIPD